MGSKDTRDPLESIKDLVDYCNVKFDADPASNERKMLVEATLCYQALVISHQVSKTFFKERDVGLGHGELVKEI